MSECCPDCKEREPELRAYRDDLLKVLEDVMRRTNLRVGTADCDVNAIAVDGKLGSAQRHLEEAHNDLTALFRALGVRD